jgi:hypothetical protein
VAVTVTTTVSMVTALGLGALFGVVAIVALVVLLAGRELGVAIGSRTQTFVRGLSLAITPLMMTFVVIIARRLASLI